jgi:mannose-6-phosphate isomerase-like protein (cupin superfamily)
MIYLIGGAPRVGKSILSQRLSSRLRAGWISTDLLADMLRVQNPAEQKVEWNANPAAITAVADYFMPYLERFIWGVTSMSESYIIEGVSFLPSQVAQLSGKYPVSAIFLGCSKMTLEQFDRFPGRSPGYSFLPDVQRRQIVQDVPHWSEFIRQEAARLGYTYIDMAGDFNAHLMEAEAFLINGLGGSPSSGIYLPVGKDRFLKRLFTGPGIPLDSKVSSTDTHGGMYVFEHRSMGKGGPPRHFHHEQDEWFYVIQGEYRFEIGDQQFRAGSGDSLFAPRQIPHVWANISDIPGTLLIAVQPAGSMEAFFEQIAQITSPLTTQEQAHLFKAHGMQITGPPLPLD